LTVAVLENAGISRPGVGFKFPLFHFGQSADRGMNLNLAHDGTGIVPDLPVS
jgi:hypothetical protein